MQEQTKELTRMFVYQGKRCRGEILNCIKCFKGGDKVLQEIEIEFFKKDFEDLNIINFFDTFNLVIEGYFDRQIISRLDFTPKTYSILYNEDIIKIKFTL